MYVVMTGGGADPLGTPTSTSLAAKLTLEALKVCNKLQKGTVRRQAIAMRCVWLMRLFCPFRRIFVPIPPP